MTDEQNKLLESYIRNLRRLVRCQRLLEEQKIAVGLTLGPDWNCVTVASDLPDADEVAIMTQIRKEIE